MTITMRNCFLIFQKLFNFWVSKESFDEEIVNLIIMICPDKVRESGGSVIIYCLAGISRSATVAISYVMRHLKMSSEDSYR